MSIPTKGNHTMTPSRTGLRRYRSTLSRLFLPLLLLNVLSARGEFLPTLLIVDVQVSDPAAYTKLIAQANGTMRTKHQVPLFLRAYESISLPEKTPARFALYPGASAEALAANRRLFAADPELVDLRAQLDRLVSAGPEILLKAVRFDGTNTPGWLINTLVKTDDEASLLARVVEFSSRLTLPDRPKPLINVFRVTAGTSAYTHLVSVNSATAEQLVERRGALTATGLSLAFANPSGTRCEIVLTTEYRELLPASN